MTKAQDSSGGLALISAPVLPSTNTIGGGSTVCFEAACDQEGYIDSILVAVDPSAVPSLEVGPLRIGRAVVELGERATYADRAQWVISVGASVSPGHRVSLAIMNRSTHPISVGSPVFSGLALPGLEAGKVLPLMAGRGDPRGHCVVNPHARPYRMLHKVVLVDGRPAAEVEAELDKLAEEGYSIKSSCGASVVLHGLDPVSRELIAAEESQYLASSPTFDPQK